MKPTESIEFNRGSFIFNNMNESEWVVVYIENRALYLLACNFTKFIVKCVSMDKAIENFRSGKWKFNEHVTRIIPDDISEVAKKELERNRMIFNEMYEAYGPTFSELSHRTDKTERVKIANKYHLSERQVTRIVLKYIQSGFEDYSLVDEKKLHKAKKATKGKKRGAKPKGGQGGIVIDKKVEKYFDEAIRNYYNTEESLQNVFDTMLGEHYMIPTESGEVLAPYNERPHFDQFVYYFEKYGNKERTEKKKYGRDEWENNMRPLRGTSRSAVGGPGFVVECDEEEYPVYLVDRDDRTLVIGKPVVYWGIDLYSDLILMFHVSFENNSYLGITNMLMNLKQNKNDLLASYGLPPIDEDVWPTDITPVILKSDRGSEYLGKELDRFCRELGINHQIAPPRRGSAKGTVERLNNESVNELAPYLKNHGLVNDDYEDDAVKNAIFDIDQFTKMILVFLVKHNMQTITSRKFIYPPELVCDVKKGKHFSRSDLWRYGVNKYGPPKPLPPVDQFLWSLMVPDTASISRAGIYYHTLMYFAPYDDAIRDLQIEAGNKAMKINIRYDPRRVGTIYMNIDGTFHEASIDVNNPILSDVAKLSRKVYDELYVDSDLLARVKEEINLPLDHFAKEVYKDVTSEAKSSHPDEANKKQRLKSNNAMAKEVKREQDAMKERFKESSQEETEEDTLEMKDNDIYNIDYAEETEEERLTRLARVMFDEEE